MDYALRAGEVVPQFCSWRDQVRQGLLVLEASFEVADAQERICLAREAWRMIRAAIEAPCALIAEHQEAVVSRW